jgi:hypothetical protein
MTQAFNLSQLANNLNTSGQLDATDGLTGAVPVANGGTGASVASTARTNLGLGTLATFSPSGTASSSTYLRGDNTWATVSGGISAQNCSYTGSLVESGGRILRASSAGSTDLGSNRVVTGIRSGVTVEGCSEWTTLWLRGYNIKNTA